MDIISEKLVEEAWVEVGSLAPEHAMSEVKKLGKRQPDLMGFMLELTQDLSEEAKELAFYMFFVVCRMFEKGSPKKTRRIPARKIIKCYEANERFLEKLALTDQRFLERIAESEFWEQPYVLKYVVEALMEAPEGDDPVQLSEEEFGFLFLLLKTVIDLLDKAADAI